MLLSIVATFCGRAVRRVAFGECVRDAKLSVSLSLFLWVSLSLPPSLSPLLLLAMAMAMALPHSLSPLLLSLPLSLFLLLVLALSRVLPKLWFSESGDQMTGKSSGGGRVKEMVMGMTLVLQNAKGCTGVGLCVGKWLFDVNVCDTRENASCGWLKGKLFYAGYGCGMRVD